MVSHFEEGVQLALFLEYVKRADVFAGIGEEVAGKNQVDDCECVFSMIELGVGCPVETAEVQTALVVVRANELFHELVALFQDCVALFKFLQSPL